MRVRRSAPSALESRVGQDVHDEVQIAGRTAAVSRLAFARRTHARAFSRAGGNAHFDRPLFAVPR